MYKKFIILLAIYFFATICWTQNVAINGNAQPPDPSAMLDIQASDKGVLIPRVSLLGTTDITTIQQPATSLLVYNTASNGTGNTAVTPGFYYWDGTTWVSIQDNTNTNTGGFTRYVGELWGGGIVFYVYKDANGIERGLIANLFDNSTGRFYSNSTSAVVPGGATSRWNGFANSNAMRLQNNNSAGADCRNTTINGYTDWYLGAVTEMQLLYSASMIINYTISRYAPAGATEIAQGWYWTSTESNSDYAWRIRFRDGYVINVNDDGNGTKSTNYRVRCIRAF